MGKKVLVPIDGSKMSFRALRGALEQFEDADVVVYHVSSLFEPGYTSAEGSIHEPMIGSEQWYAMEQDSADQLLAEAASIAEDQDREVDTAWDVGDPQRLIPEFAVDEDVDHIVMGIHGRDEAGRSIVGRVAESVVFRAPVSVTVIR